MQRAQQRLLKRFDGAGDSWSKEQLMTLWQTVFPDREYVQGTVEFKTVRACAPQRKVPYYICSLIQPPIQNPIKIRADRRNQTEKETFMS